MLQLRIYFVHTYIRTYIHMYLLSKTVLLVMTLFLYFSYYRVNLILIFGYITIEMTEGTIKSKLMICS